jgi:thiopeptide-type bacteriocin biosynthesis protein
MHFNFTKNFIYRHPANSFLENKLDDETLYLASPVLLEEKLKGETNEKIKLSLKKYSQRASSRCTPFGLFAGCGIGNWSNINHIENQNKFRHTRLDMNVVCEIALLITSHPLIKTLLTYNTNNSLYRVADKYRYVEYTLLNKIRNYQISSIDATSYLNDILLLTKNKTSYASLVECLLKYNVNYEEAVEFINELIQSQVIVTNLYPNVTGTEFHTVILNTVKDILHRLNFSSIANESSTLETSVSEKKKNEAKAEIERIYKLLEEIVHELRKIDGCFKNEVSVYQLIYGKLKELLPGLTEENLFQTDLYYKSNNAFASYEIQSQLNETVSFLNKLYPANDQENLNKFKTKFLEHYEDQEMPLLQVLDTASGIGYLNKDTHGINSIIDDINYSTNVEESYSIKWKAIHGLLLKKISKALSGNLKSIEFTNEDIKNDIPDKHLFPPSIAVFFSIISKSKNTVHFKYASGSSASNLLGRFANGNGEIHNLIKEVTEHENQFYSDKIMAEIVHLPENRIGNVLLRPQTHKYELAYMANSIKGTENIIDLNDVMLSVKNNKIILRSKIHGKEIIPRLTTAHNFAQSTLPVYQFLCDMQNQYYNKTGFLFNWGPLSNMFDFLPRASYKNTILAPAQWNIGKEKITEIISCLKQYEQGKVLNWKESLDLPDRFVLTDGDNELLVNINDQLSVMAFASVIKKRENIVLHEFLFDEEDALITDTEGNSFTNELIAILLNQEKPIQAPPPVQVTDNTKRIFAPGSEWLYYKIYCNPKMAEDILTEQIYSLVQSYKESELIEKWFFIRYADPDNHIRVRLKLANAKHLSLIQTDLNSLFNPLLESRLIEKVQIDTYYRELERYGFQHINDVETLFYIDSENILELISQLNNDDVGDLIRLKYACLNIYILMQNFHLEKEKLSSVVSLCQQNYFNEHGGQKELQFLLNDKYRKYRKSIEKLLTIPNLDILEEEDQFILNTISKKDKLQAQLINSILEKNIEQNKKIEVVELIQSLIHMHVNRLFKSKQRTYELLVYDFLQRCLKSVEARKHKTESKAKENLVTLPIQVDKGKEIFRQII